MRSLGDVSRLIASSGGSDWSPGNPLQGQPHFELWKRLANRESLHDLDRLLEQSLESSDHSLRWSARACGLWAILFPEFLSTELDRDFVERLAAVLGQHPAEADSYADPVSCHFLTTIEVAASVPKPDRGRPLDGPELSAVISATETIHRLLRKVDPDFQPGRSPSWAFVMAEGAACLPQMHLRRSPNPAKADKRDLASWWAALARAMIQVVRSCENGFEDLDRADELTDALEQLTRTTVDVSRSARSVFRDPPGPVKSTFLFSLAQRSEVLRAVGEAIVGAATDATILRLLDDAATIKGKFFRLFPGKRAWWIREAGLEVDPRYQPTQVSVPGPPDDIRIRLGERRLYLHDLETRGDRRLGEVRLRPGTKSAVGRWEAVTEYGATRICIVLHQKWAGHLLTIEGGRPEEFEGSLWSIGRSRPPAKRNHSMRSPTSGFLKACLIAAQREDPHWAEILARLAEGDDAEGRLLTREAIDDLEPHLLLSAFRVCMENGQLRCAHAAARKALAVGEALPLEAALEFAAAMIEPAMVAPFTIDVGKLETWQHFLGEWLTELDTELDSASAASVHDALMGVGAWLNLSGHQTARRFLTRRYHDRLADVRGVEQQDAHKASLQLTEKTVRSRRARRAAARTPGTNRRSLNRLQSTLQQLEHPTLGRPVHVSIARLSEERWSILMTTATQSRSLGVRTFPDREPLDVSRECWESPFSIPWDDCWLDLMRSVLDEARALEPRCEWLSLSVDPTLTDIPFQSLALAVSRIDRTPLIGITINPGSAWLSSLRWGRRHGQGNGMGEVRCPSSISGSRTGGGVDGGSANRLDRLCRELDSDSDQIVEAGWAVVVGHGDDDGFCEVDADRPLGLDDWLDLGGERSIGAKRIVVVHSCWSGRGSHSRSRGDLGGIPGACLFSSTRALLAPVCPVRPDTAIGLHRALHEGLGKGKTIGEAYMTRVQSDESASRFVLYGHPSEPLRRP